VSDGAEVWCAGRLFQRLAAETGKARLLTAVRLKNGTISWSDVDDRNLIRDGCFGNWLDHCLSMIHKKKKSWPESVGEFLTTWMLSSLSRQWLCIYARQCSVILRKSTATVSTREQTRLHSCWWLDVVFSNLNPTLQLRYTAGFGVRRPTTSVRKAAGRQRDYHNGKRFPSRQFENPLHNGKDDWVKLTYRMMALFNTFFASFCDCWEISCILTRWTNYTVSQKIHQLWNSIA